MKQLSKGTIESIFIGIFVVIACASLYITKVKSYKDGFVNGAEQMLYAVTDTLNKMVKEKQSVDTINIDKYKWTIKIERQ